MNEEISKEENVVSVSNTNKSVKNPWKIATIILIIAIVFILAYFIFFKGGITGGVISENDAAGKLVDYLNARTGGGVEFVSVEDMGNIYQVLVTFQGDEIPVYVTKDGQYFVQGITPLAVTTTDTQQPTASVPKADKPEVELFVMTHCPYGTQAEKGIIPVLELLGDKIDGGIRFVHYFMHDPEETETPIQVCIREEQEDKYFDYLKCFLEDGDSDRCLTETGIDETKLDSCVESKSEEYYSEDSSLSEGYGVRGSPTLVINGEQVSSGRDSASYLSVVCSAFNDAPSECNEELSSTSPSPGFGYSETGGSSTGTC